MFITMHGHTYLPCIQRIIMGPLLASNRVAMQLAYILDLNDHVVEIKQITNVSCP